jgi:GMP synthase (glutamine-hydrolysing)
MTCDYTRIPHGTVAHRVAHSNEVDGVSRVVIDVTGKPPAIIEWE